MGLRGIPTLLWPSEVTQISLAWGLAHPLMSAGWKDCGQSKSRKWQGWQPWPFLLLKTLWSVPPLSWVSSINLTDVALSFPVLLLLQHLDRIPQVSIFGYTISPRWPNHSQSYSYISVCVYTSMSTLSLHLCTSLFSPSFSSWAL